MALSAAVVSLFFPLSLPLACDPSPACAGGWGWEWSGGRERTSYETNGQAQQTRQTTKRHRFPFPAMPACSRPAAAAGGAVAGPGCLCWFDADADAAIVTLTAFLHLDVGASFIRPAAFVCRQVSTYPDAVGDKAGRGRTPVQPSRAGCKPQYICTVHGLYGTDWSFQDKGQPIPCACAAGVGCSCSPWQSPHVVLSPAHVH